MAKLSLDSLCVPGVDQCRDSRAECKPGTSLCQCQDGYFDKVTQLFFFLFDNPKISITVEVE